jgi:phytoene dehydrogenase-like protein
VVDRPDVIVVGAGLAGLAAAIRLREAGRDVRVLEASDAPGGRMRSDAVDGFTIDRGFQVLNTAYPEVRRLDALHGVPSGAFTSGALVRHGDRLTPVGDPRRMPGAAAGLLRAPLGSAGDRIRLGAFLAGIAAEPADRIRARRDEPFHRTLRRRRIAGGPTAAFLRPFLAGVLLDDRLETSNRFAEFVLRSFVRGTVVVPHGGMGAVPAALAARLGGGSGGGGAGGSAIEYGMRVDAVRPGAVEVDGRTLAAREVIVAADPVTASALLGMTAPRMRAATTIWHAAPEPPVRRPVLALDADGGPITSSVVISAAAASYAPPGRALVATSVLGSAVPDDVVLRRELTRLWGRAVGDWEVVAVSSIPAALPALPGGSPLQRRVRIAPGLLVAGDWRDTPSIQGALVSGRRAADAALG